MIKIKYLSLQEASNVSTLDKKYNKYTRGTSKSISTGRDYFETVQRSRSSSVTGNRAGSHGRVGLVPGPRRARVQRVLAPQRAAAVRRAVRQQPHVVRLHRVRERRRAAAARARPRRLALRVALAGRQQVEVGRPRRLQLRQVGARRRVRAGARLALALALDAERRARRRRGERRRHERRGLVVAGGGLVARRAAVARAAAAHDLVLEAREALGGADLAQDVGGAAEAAQLEVDDGRAGARGVLDGARARGERGGRVGRVVGHEQRGGPLARAARGRRRGRVGGGRGAASGGGAGPRAEGDLSAVGVLLVLDVEGDGGRVGEGAARAEAAGALEDGRVARRRGRRRIELLV